MRNEDEPFGSARWQDAADLAAALRREADEAPAGPAPVEALMRAGRRRRRRGRAAVSAASAALLTVVAAAWVTGAWPLAAEHPPAPQVASSPSHPTEPESLLHTVEPYEPVAVAPGLRLGLLPGPRQNSVLAPTESYAESLQARRSAPVGDHIRPRSISGGYESTDAEGFHVVYGTWRLDEPPGRIVVTAAGGDHPADLYTLPGDPGWGVYVLDAASLPRFTAYTVTAYDGNGRVFDTLQVSRVE